MEGSEVLTVLNQGTTAHVIAETDGWYKVQLSNGTSGWVGQTLLKSTDEAVDQVKTTETVSAKKVAEPEKTDLNLSKRIAGYILLQVQQNGEAYYVNEEGLRFYLKDGGVAYEMMRKLGLGITSKDLEKLKAKNSDLQKRLKGKIVLDVQKNGEAYYVYPKDGTVHYLKNGEAAYKLMRKLGLGITDKDLKQIKKTDLAAYLVKKSADKKIESAKAEVKSEAVVSGQGEIIASAVVNESVAKIIWTVAGMETPLGFKVVISSEPNPVYPGNDYHYLSNSSVRKDIWENLSAGTHHFRVCEYLGGKCGVYSNDMTVTIAAQNTEVVVESTGSIALNASKTDNGVSLNWSLADMTSSMGFKVVWSANANPVYPGNDYHYLSSASSRADSVSELTAGSTYHFRVCEYLGGKCGVYSNDVSVNY
jgi:hypothetical protein